MKIPIEYKLNIIYKNHQNMNEFKRLHSIPKMKN